MLTNFFEIIFSFLCFNKLSQKILKAKKIGYFKAYSKSISKQFMKCGNDFLIETPCTVKGPENIEIGSNCYIHSDMRLETYTEYKGVTYKPFIAIGDNVIINNNCHIGAINKIVIGNNVLIASKVFITDHFHGDSNRIDLVPVKRNLISKGPVIIEDNVWVGEGVCILPGVKVGKNAIIGANSVVSKDVPPNAVVGGVPARIIKINSEV